MMDWGMWRRWALATTVGELAGFMAPAVAGAWIAAANVSAWPGYAVMLAAGAIEGWCLGFAQAWALSDPIRSLPRKGFALATSAAAAGAYAIGMLPSTLGDRLTAMPAVLLGSLAATGCLVLLASIGTAQFLVLRRAGLGRWWWVVATAGSWLAGLMIFLAVATPLWQAGQPLALTVAIGVFAGLVMAAMVAALTGLAAARLVQPNPGR